ncbi:hypothetical protein CBA19CS22_34445 [Caballeronia novacaledonica]|uniref:Uncharacterized protein n=1 Tax=Caballeronia novacaledonica TaxID=1544861 RepID=A0ACB5R335_9BURK|nr:hypothetical protein CBA19CS22_34445 [Caballeronia novacaledonica]
MDLPAYLVSYNLASLPLDYPWNSELFNTFWAPTDESNPRLASQINSITTKAAYALGIACSEWVIARVDGHAETADSLLRTEAAWTASLDRSYAKLPLPDRIPPSDPQEYAYPLLLAMRLAAYAHQTLGGSGVGVRTCAHGLAALVDHIAGRHPAFAPWLSDSLRRCATHFPDAGVPLDQQEAVPKDFFEPGFVWRDGMAIPALERFVATLDPTKNPYLHSADAMRAAGFTGVPYGPAP